ncbi:hypothetical protein P171DRAFT_480879 [Karstenula rhodostoma CBS 690.94]|uniref:Uncharacterized protein n=1 Tax=Karstenula rhodostoma CBS 690.94 TaxID=1392251 RepID=A0A9P4PT83_9PLEO|nr:hypothetical protein P171DRAFT_480879 [Karstenula rhodostoma CBS 690.94]
MASSQVDPSNPLEPNPFPRGWNSLPTELRLQILSYILTINLASFNGPHITINDYTPPPYTSENVRHTGRFAALALPLLTCSAIDAETTLTMWYGTNVFFLGGPSNRGCGEKLAYPYLVPNRNAFAYLQRVRVYIRGDYAGWVDLARYCAASKTMPTLRVFYLEFVRQGEVDAGAKALGDACEEVGRLEVAAEKFSFQYYGKSGLLGPIRPPVVGDRMDYPEMAGIMRMINIVGREKVVKEVFRRFWYDCLVKVEVDGMWELPPKSIYPWQKHVVRTQWL